MRSLFKLLKWRFHVPHLRGGEERDYFLLFLFTFAIASVEVYIALKLAQSSSALADGIHAYSHSFLLLLLAITGWSEKRWYFKKQIQGSLRLGMSAFFALITVLTLCYIVFHEALPRWHTPVLVGISWMVIAAAIGLAGSLIALACLKGIQKSHNTHDAAHSIVSLDTLFDVLTSFAVIFGAILQGYGFNRADSLITFFAAGWITIRLPLVFWNEAVKRNSLD